MTGRPNFLIIVADDLGFSDVGCFGSEIQTPSLDQLGKHGSRFTDFHTAAACSPTRAMLMSGTDHHLVGLGQLMETVRHSPAHQGKPGHEGYLTDNIATLPEVLRDEGYHTMMSGKWHLGLKPEHSPIARGFTRSFALLPGCANHYGWEPQLEPQNDQPRSMETAWPALHMEDGCYVNNSTLPSDFYSSDYYVDKMLQFMKERPAEKPFFAYLPFSAPHYPLQAPKANMDRYRGLYEDGPDALRSRRLDSLKAKKLVPNDVQPHPVVANELPEWSSMDAPTRAKSARSMEAYAGMVDCMDEDIGQLLSYLKEHGLYENTMIIFMSDNGAEGASMETRPVMGDQLMVHLKKYYNNALDNIGRKDSYAWYGTRWAQASTAPSRLYKHFSTEGGVRVPMIMKAAKEHHEAICHQFCTVMDIMPTILQLANIAKPGNVYNGRDVLDIRGISWVPFLQGTAARIHAEDHVTGWELNGQAALRKGNWKINWVYAPKGPEVWQLYDLTVDPGEINDLGESRKEKLNEMIALWEEYARDNNVVGLKTDFERIIMKDETENPTAWMDFETSGSILQDLKESKGFASVAS